MKVFWFDVETTGLDPEKHEIVQLAYQMVTDGGIVGERNILMRPDRPEDISPKALKVQGRTLDDVMAFPARKLGWRQFIADLDMWISKWNRTDKAWYGGYNVEFDCDFLWAESRAQDERFFGSYWFGYAIDPYPVAQFLAGTGLLEWIQGRKLTLGTLCKHFAIDLQAHDALSDIKATRELTHKIVDLMDRRESWIDPC